MRNPALARWEAEALTQPDHWEPDSETCADVQAFAEQMVGRLPSRDDETFEQCRLCGEVDSHFEDCPLPALQAWLEGDK